jgi:LacI family transcriptional regulator
MGREAAKRLIEQIENPLTTIVENLTVEGTLIAGKSVAKIDPGA